MRDLLGKYMRVELTDGRVIVGRFYCLDLHRNLVLRDAEEWAPPDVLRAEAPSATAKRFIGATVMVPGRHMVRCEAESPDGAQ